MEMASSKIMMIMMEKHAPTTSEIIIAESSINQYCFKESNAPRRMIITLAVIKK